MATSEAELDDAVKKFTGTEAWKSADPEKRRSYVRNFAIEGQRAGAPEEFHRDVTDKLYEAAGSRGFLSRAGGFLAGLVKFPAEAGTAAVAGLSDATGVTDSGSGARFKSGFKDVGETIGQRLKQIAPGDEQGKRDDIMELFRKDLDEKRYPKGLPLYLSGDYDKESPPEAVKEARDYLEKWKDLTLRGAIKASTIGADPDAEDQFQIPGSTMKRSALDAWKAGPGRGLYDPHGEELISDYIATRDPSVWKGISNLATETDNQFKNRMALRAQGATLEQQRELLADENGKTGFLDDLALGGMNLQSDPVALALTALPVLRGVKALRAATAGEYAASAEGAAARSALKDIGKSTLHGAAIGAALAASKDPRATAGEIGESAAEMGLGMGGLTAAGIGAGKTLENLGKDRIPKNPETPKDDKPPEHFVPEEMVQSAPEELATKAAEQVAGELEANPHTKQTADALREVSNPEESTSPVPDAKEAPNNIQKTAFLENEEIKTEPEQAGKEREAIPPESLAAVDERSAKIPEIEAPEVKDEPSPNQTVQPSSQKLAFSKYFKNPKPEDSETLKTVESHIENILPDFQHVFENGVEVVGSAKDLNQKGRTGGFATSGDGKSLVIDLSGIRDHIQSVKDPKEWMLSAISEEAIESTIVRLKGEKKIDPEGLFSDLRKENKRIYSDFRKAYKSKTEEEASREFLRKVVQGKVRITSGGISIDGRLTEMNFSESLMKKFRDTLERILSFIRDTQGKVSQEFSDRLETHAGNIVGTLDALMRRSQERKATPGDQPGVASQTASAASSEAPATRSIAPGVSKKSPSKAEDVKNEKSEQILERRPGEIDSGAPVIAPKEARDFEKGQRVTFVRDKNAATNGQSGEVVAVMKGSNKVNVRMPDGKIRGVDPTTIEAAKEEPVAGVPETKPAKPPGKSKPSEKNSDDGYYWTSATADEPLPGGDLMRTQPAPKGDELLSGVPFPNYKTRRASEMDVVTARRSGALQASTSEAHRAVKAITKVAKTERRRNAISIWLEANGDASVLKRWESSAKGKEFKLAAADAQSLTPSEIKIAEAVKKTFEIMEARGTKYGVLNSHRDNYVPHIWDIEKRQGGFGTNQLQKNFKFAKARTFANFAEGDAADFKPKTLDISKILPAYLETMNRTIADRQFVRELSKGKASDGRPLVVPRGKVNIVESEDSGGSNFLALPKGINTIKDAEGEKIEQMDYKVMESQPALTKWLWKATNENGNSVLMESDLALHPEAALRLKSILGRSRIREWYENPAAKGISRVPMAIVKGLDKSQSILKREMFGLLSPFHQVQEGTHAVGHLVNPFFGIPKIDLRDAGQRDAANHGLMLQSDKTSGGRYIEGVGTTSSFLSRAAKKFGGAPGRALSEIVDGYQSYLFEQYIPGLKYKTYEKILSRNSKRYQAELSRGDLKQADVKFLSAEQTNAAYGHLNYALMDRSPTVQHFMQLGLLAPDFLEARARFTGQAIKSISKDPRVGAEQMKAIAVLALSQMGAAYTISQVTGSKWDPNHPFEVVNGNRRYTLRSVPEDIFNLFKDTRQFIYGRVNPLVAKGTIQLVTGQNYRGEKTTTMETMGELLSQYIPITARSLPGIRNLTETSKQNPISPLEQLAGSMGLRISKYSPISEVYKEAGKWMDDQEIPRDRGSYPVSKYSRMKNALEDGDMEKAQEMYGELLKEKDMTREKVKKGFHESMSHPFTRNKDEDAKFRKSLDSEKKAIYDLAVKRRKDIYNRFLQLKH